MKNEKEKKETAKTEKEQMGKEIRKWTDKDIFVFSLAYFLIGFMIGGVFI